MIHHRGKKDAKGTVDELSYNVIGAAIDVHRALGPGLLESAYEACLFRELQHRGVLAERQVPLPVTYRGERLECGYRLDLVVDNVIIVEVKAIRRLKPIHTAQLLTYLRLRRLSLGLLFNFNVVVLRAGLQRVVNDTGPLRVLLAFAVILCSASA
jgi:GxxExxY protein